MRFGTLIGIIVSGLTSVVVASTDRPNEPPGAVFLSENALSSKPTNNYQSAGTWWDIYPTGNAQIVSDASAPKSPSGVLQQTRPPNSTGGTVIGYSFPQPRKEVYAAFWWKPSSPFYGWDNGTQKIASFQPSMNMFLIWAGPRTGSRWLQVLLQCSPRDPIQVDNSHAGCPDPNSSCNFVPNMGAGGVTGGQWHLIEWYVKLSDTHTSKNGILRWWVDGQLAGNWTNINMRTELYENFQFNHTWDSGDPNQTTTDYHWFDHAYISGPNGAPPVLMMTTSFPSARTGVPYSVTLTADGGKTPYNWILESGSLPPGLTLSAGRISGTPTMPGKSAFTLRVTDSNQPALTTTKSFSIVASGTIGIGAQQQPNQNHLALSATQNRGHVRFDLPFAGEGKYSISVFNLQGKNVWNHSGVSVKGQPVEAVWSYGGNLARGVYLVRAEQGGRKTGASFCQVW